MTRGLDRRLAELEESRALGGRVQVIPIHEGQTDADAVAVYERELGPLGPERKGDLRVFIRKFCPAPAGA